MSIGYLGGKNYKKALWNPLYIQNEINDYNQRHEFKKKKNLSIALTKLLNSNLFREKEKKMMSDIIYKELKRYFTIVKQRSFQPRVWTQVSCTADGFFMGWATMEAKEYCSQSLLQFFLIQELIQAFPYCRQILYRLSYQGSPKIFQENLKV